MPGREVIMPVEDRFYGKRGVFNADLKYITLLVYLKKNFFRPNTPSINVLDFSKLKFSLLFQIWYLKIKINNLQMSLYGVKKLQKFPF